jgi:hypothetical protein
LCDGIELRGFNVDHLLGRKRKRIPRIHQFPQ